MTRSASGRYHRAQHTRQASVRKVTLTSQHIEWKESWRDDHLRWICGFANADGGVLVVGRNDKGRVVGVADAGEVTGEVTTEVTTEVRLLRAH